MFKIIVEDCPEKLLNNGLMNPFYGRELMNPFYGREFFQKYMEIYKDFVKHGMKKDYEYEVIIPLIIHN